MPSSPDVSVSPLSSDGDDGKSAAGGDGGKVFEVFDRLDGMTAEEYALEERRVLRKLDFVGCLGHWVEMDTVLMPDSHSPHYGGVYTAVH